MKRRGVATALLVVVGAGLLASCSATATPTSDTYLCVFAGGGSQRLKYQLPPGSDQKDIGQNDTVVEIPASNRFYMAAKDDSIRDPLAPHFYPGNALGGVEVELEGQIRMRFNLPKACEWYSKHGRRNATNGDLAFNARGADAENSGWLQWLAENFGFTMGSVAKRVLNGYDWAALHYDYPINANNIGVVPKDEQPGEATSQKLGKELGEEFTKEIDSFLGGQYFCGTETTPGSATCPPLTFQVLAVTPGGPAGEKLIADRSAVESTKQQLQTSQLEGQLQQQQAATVQENEAAKQKIATAQAATAAVEARADKEIAHCLVLASVGLDCEGHFPNQIVVGGSTPQK